MVPKNIHTPHHGENIWKAPDQPQGAFKSKETKEQLQEKIACSQGKSPCTTPFKRLFTGHGRRVLCAAEYLFCVTILNPFQESYLLWGANNLFRESQNSLRGANNKLLREVSRYVLFTTSFVLKYICCVGNRGWPTHNKQNYLVWNNRNTLYIEEKLSVQLGFVLITTGIILFYYLLCY